MNTQPHYIKINQSLYKHIMNNDFTMTNQYINNLLDETFRPALRSIQKHENIKYNFPEEFPEYLIAYLTSI